MKPCNRFLIITFIYVFLSWSRWYFGTMNRFEAQNHLLAPENGHGAFLIRSSEKDNVGYVLSGKTRSRGVMKEAKKTPKKQDERGVWCRWVEVDWEKRELHFTSKITQDVFGKRGRYRERESYLPVCKRWHGQSDKREVAEAMMLHAQVENVC